jgi:putative endonuclease
MTNINRTVIYTGITNNLSKRVWEHRNKKGTSFTARYNITQLVYYERFDNIYEAISAEKKVKAGSRTKKIMLIESMNPKWDNLSEN